MAQLDPSIILAGRPANILGAMEAGNALAQQTNQLQTENALRQVYQQHGAGIARGETNALNALAAYDPMAAFDISTGIEDRTYRRQRDARADERQARLDERADQEWEIKLAHYAATLSQQEREAQAAQVESAVKMGLAAQSPQEWDALVAQSGAPDLVGQFGNREALAQKYMTVAEILKRGAGPEFRVVSGAEAAAMGLNPSNAYNIGADGKITQIGGGGVTVNNNMATDKFAEAFAKSDADALAAISDAGISAQRNLSRIDQLDALLKASPSGFAAAAAQRAGEWGIKTEGLDTIQAAQALINSLVPEQRQPGSGPMSDADLELFKQSLPRLINQPGGNQLIIDTMRAVAQYDAEGAQIVQQLRTGTIDRATAFQMLQRRQNPLAQFSAGAPAAQAQQPAPAQRRRYNPQTGEFE